MKRVLYIKAGLRGDDISNTYLVSNAFIEQYKLSNPFDEVVVYDLASMKIGNLDLELLNKMKSGEPNRALDLANDFKSFDKYVVAAPMHNLSVPGILKAYIDHIAYSKVTFRYTEHGVEGLLHNRKVIHINSCGSAMKVDDSTLRLEHDDHYLRSIFKFMGVHDFTTIRLDKTDMLTGEDLLRAKNKAIDKAIEIADIF